MNGKKITSWLAGFISLFVVLAIYKPFMPKEARDAAERPVPTVYLSENGAYSNCVLRNVPGTINDAVSAAHTKKCLSEARLDFNDPPVGMSDMSAPDCVIKYASNTASQVAGRVISMACYHLYSKPPTPGLFDDVIQDKKQ